MDFKKASPESKGIPSQHILQFLDDLEKKHIPMHSFLLLKEDVLLAEGYYSPYKKETLHRMFSISKSFTAIAVGILASEGKLSLSDPIINYFPEKVPKDIHPWIAELTIQNMLMMRTCHASTTYKGAGADWVGSFFTTPPTHKSGTIFHYDTSAAHVLCALVEKLSGMKMLDFLKDRLSELDFSKDSYMLTDPEGISMGGSGLVATSMDVLKFGYLLLKEGSINGKQLVPASFIREATSCLTETAVTGPIPSESCGYGYMIWQNEKGSYVLYGMGGQLVVILPEEQLILVTTADTQGISGGNQLIYDAFYADIYDPLRKKREVTFSSEAASALPKKLQNLSLSPLSCFVAGKEWELFSPIMKKVHQKTFHIVDSSLKSANQEQNVSVFNDFTFIFDKREEGELEFTLNDKSYYLSFGFGKLVEGIFPIYDLKYASSGVWLDQHTLYLRFHIIDKYTGSVHMQFFFGEDDLTIYMKKNEESCFEEFRGHFYGKMIN